jgi:hypothetical protein
MRIPQTTRNWRRLTIFCTAFAALAVVPLLSRAQPSTSVNIVNNSSREIRDVYFSHVNADDWTGNQLGDTTIPAGSSATVNNDACNAQQIRVISEDQDGCFSFTVINCGENSTWTVTNDTARDCGH